MAGLGPFETEPHLAVAVSGGADSLALALLARKWSAARGGAITALIVDHQLRPQSAYEATWTAHLLQNQSFPTRVLSVGSLPPGPALAARARAARYRALSVACAEAGILHLLTGHHAADQAETVLIRSLGRSGQTGLAAMPAVTETDAVRLLRPLLTVAPARLRATLSAAGLPWAEDPSNADRRALRSRLRAERRDPGGWGPATRALCAAARADGEARVARGQALARALAEGASLRPEGFALLPHRTMPADALAALIRTVGGRAFGPGLRPVGSLAADLRPATLAGTRLLPAGRLGPGLLLVREVRAVQPPVDAVSGAVWDGRFRLHQGEGLPPHATLGALGQAARRFREPTHLPASVLQTLPALRSDDTLLAVPHLGYFDAGLRARPVIGFAPPDPAACADWHPA
ncbi:MAG: tRNA lysidine(34) synthetase TilS [Acetobacteraceae bacterium]|nr:tRNA lysidine(34) synthetase TilS [Acetobacteraceae bacterium]